MSWPFEEGEYSVIDSAFIWQKDRPRVTDALVICHMQHRYKKWIRMGLATDILSEARNYRTVYQVISPPDGPSVVGPIGHQMDWAAWTTTEGEVLLDAKKCPSRSRSIPKDAFRAFGNLKSVSLCGGAYGGGLLDVAKTLTHLGVEVNLLAELVY